MSAFEKRAVQYSGAFWNVTEIIAACERGEHGEPITLPMSLIEDVMQTDEDKVARYARTPEALASPAIILTIPFGDRSLFLADGRHRLAALRRNGARSFNAYVLIPESENAYRIPELAIKAAMNLIYRNGGPEAFTAALPQGWAAL
jgi:hypothetical protein